MGKLKIPPLKHQPKMADLVTERRKTVNLKRSKSVRASLKFISAKLLNNNSTKDMLSKTPSMSSLQDFYMPERNAEYIENYCPVETILKTPMIRVDKPSARSFKRTEKLNKNRRDLLDGHVKISTPPDIIAPKAAQLLQIPMIKENGEPYRDVDSKNNGLRRIHSEKCPQHGKFSDYSYDYRNNGFQRGTLRLSITRRKNSQRNSSLSDDENKSRYISFV